MDVRFEGVVLAEGKRVRYAHLEEGERLYCILPTLGASAWVGVEEGALRSEGFAVEHWGAVAVLLVAEDAVFSRRVRQEQMAIDGVDYTVTAVCEARRTTVWVDSLSSRLYVLPSGEEVEVRFAPALSAVLFDVSQRGAHYVVLASLYEGEIMYEGWTDGYTLGDTLEVECTFADMKRHTRIDVLGYRDGSFGRLARSFTCAYLHAYISALTPYLFCEAIAVGDVEEARSYVSDALVPDFDNLLSYVGEVKAVRCPPVGHEASDVGVVDAEGKGQILRFEMEGDKICDVRCLD